MDRVPSQSRASMHHGGARGARHDGAHASWWRASSLAQGSRCALARASACSSDLLQRGGVDGVKVEDLDGVREKARKEHEWHAHLDEVVLRDVGRESGQHR